MENRGIKELLEELGKAVTYNEKVDLLCELISTMFTFPAEEAPPQLLKIPAGNGNIIYIPAYYVTHLIRKGKKTQVVFNNYYARSPVLLKLSMEDAMQYFNKYGLIQFDKNIASNPNMIMSANIKDYVVLLTGIPKIKVLEVKVPKEFRQNLHDLFSTATPETESDLFTPDTGPFN